MASDPDLVAAVLGKVLANGRLTRIPRNPAHRDVILALICLDMQRRRPYTEIGFNDYLTNALGKLKARVDHVTCRRYLVDCGFVRRDRAGHRYILNYPKLEATLTVEAMASADELVAAAFTTYRRASEERARRARLAKRKR